jgi:hypothetical protein
MTKTEVKVLGFGILGIVILVIVLQIFNAIDVAQGIQIIITFTLVVVTLVYVKRTAEIASATREQSKASIKMAEEMREQNRPIIIIKYKKIGPNNVIPFEIENIGNSPAIDLEVRLIDQSVSVQENIGYKKTYLSYRPDDNNWKIDDHLLRINNHVDNPCILICRYSRVISSQEKRSWLYTKLPFTAHRTSDKSVFFDPQYLEFSESEKEDRWEY